MPQKTPGFGVAPHFQSSSPIVIRQKIYDPSGHNSQRERGNPTKITRYQLGNALRHQIGRVQLNRIGMRG